MRVGFALISGSLAMLAGCATGPRWASGEPPVFVTAAAETFVAIDPAVDADDPALWADRANPSRAVMFRTDKSDGLYVHNLDGSVRQFLPSGALNNVDLRVGFPLGGRELVLVAATNDSKFGVNLYLFDPESLETADWGFVPTDGWEPYGFCMGRRGADFYLVANAKTGEIRIWRIAAGATGPAATLERTLRVGSQPEGCVVDDEADALYVGEEDVALWRFDFDPRGSPEPVQIAAVDGRRFTADIEGVTILRDGDNKYLIGSSQGDDTFPVFRIEGETHAYLGRFTVAASDGIDAVSSTDGLDAWSGPIGGFPEGLVAVHDDQDKPGRGQQNYKLIDWRDIRAALGLS